MKDYIIRQIKREDSKRLWEIRNHPKARENSNNPEEIPFVKHDAWFENKYFKNSDNICFVLEAEGKVIGYCRFDQDENSRYIISIALDYDYQGKGLGQLLLEETLKKIPENKIVLATVKKGNPASLKLFQKNFELDSEDEANFYYIFKTMQT
jgi:ribosomal protein S18 acetylase RimI-like enzyme